MKKALSISPKTQHKLNHFHQAYHRFIANQEYKEAFQCAFQAHKLCPSIIPPLNDMMTAALLAQDWENTILYGKKVLQRDAKHLNALDALAHAYGVMLDIPNCRLYGHQALQLRDHLVISKLPTLPELNFQTKSQGKKVISFSLYGNKAEYIESAVINAEIAQNIYPNWTCRFYVNNTVPEGAIARLKSHGVEIVYIPDSIAHWPGTMWRFLALDDPSLERVIFRDADSVISQREAKAVQAWVDSDKLFHTLRDAGSHTELILAGLWGAAVGALPSIQIAINQYLARGGISARFADQFFLREYVWPYARQSLYATDSIFGFFESKPFPDEVLIDRGAFRVGIRETRFQFEVMGDFPDQATVIWKLYTRISPLVNEDLSPNVLETERLICQYEAVAIKGKIMGYIPVRYAQGLNNSMSRIEVMLKVTGD